MPKIIADTFEFLRDLFTPLMTNIVAAIIIFLIGVIVGRIVGRLTQKLLHELELNNIFKKTADTKFDIEHAVGGFIMYFIYFIALIMALNQVGLTTTVLNILSGGIIIIIVISIILAIKDFIPNIFAGLLIHRKGFIKKGDKVSIRGIKGKVIYISLIETRIQMKDGDIFYIPNSLLTKSEIRKIKH